MRKRARLAAVIFAGGLAGCAPGQNRQTDTANAEGVIAGFPRGVWHGLISPVTFVVSLFDDEVGVYEAHNLGAWYDLGFLLGVGLGAGGGSHAGTRTRRRRPV
jgi:hypothetical protein